MKFIDTFNEDDKKRLTKKAKLIYSVLKKGTITRSDGVKFSYELGDNMVPSVVDGEIYLFAFITKIIERTYCPINEIAMSDLIMKKFDQFDIKVDLQIPKSIEIVKYKGKKPWEEPLNEEIDEYTQKQIKKARTIYKALRRGTIGGDNPEEPHFTYVLSDDFTVDTTNAGIVISLEKIKIKHLNRGCLLHSTDYMGSLIRKRFNLFGIILTNPYKDLYFDYEVDAWESPINEDIDIDKERNRVKTIHKAIRKGIVNFEGNRFRYELPEEYTFHVVDELHLQVTAIKFTFYNKDLLKDNGGGNGLPLKIWRIEGGKDVYLNKMLTGQDVGDISYNDEYGITNKTGVEYVNVKNKVRNRYRNFNINAIMTTPSDTIMVNEEEEDNDLTEKDRKKIELIYGLFKRGKYKVDDIFYNYVLPEEFWTSNNKETGELIVVLTMDPTQKMKLYAKIKKEDGNLYHREVPVEATQYASLYDDAKKRIKEKFERFNIEIVF